MGKFNEYSQKATPADNDTLMIYDATSKSNKLSPFSGIWNWIVGKLTNAVINNLQTSNKTVLGAINELYSNSHLGTLNDNIAEYLSKTNSVATAYFVWGNIGGLYPSWAWGTLLCSTDNTANFIGIANSDKTAAFAHYENGTWEKVPVESLSNLTTTNKSSLVDAINEVNSNSLNGYFHYEKFADIPKRNILCDVRYESASDPEAPDVTMGTYWWNIIQVCLAENRILQIASSAFNQRDVLYFRVKHDNNWYGWYYVIGQEKR